SGCCDCYAVRLAWTFPTPCCHGRQVRARRMECGQSIGMPKWNARRRSYRIASEKSKCRRVCIKYTRAVAKFTKSSTNTDCIEPRITRISLIKKRIKINSETSVLSRNPRLENAPAIQREKPRSDR